MPNFLDQADEVLAVIREVYLKDKKPVLTDGVYYKFKGSEGLKFMLKYLEDRNLIRRGEVFGTWIPVFKPGELERIEEEKRARVTLEKINYCITHFFKEHGAYPLSSEIRETFEKLYGVAEVKDIPRMCRKWATEDPVKLVRTADNRYMPLKVPYTKKPISKFVDEA